MINITDNYYQTHLTMSKGVEVFLIIIIILLFCCLSTFLMSVIDNHCYKKLRYIGDNRQKRKGLCYYLKKSKRKKYNNMDKVIPEETVSI